MFECIVARLNRDSETKGMAYRSRCFVGPKETIQNYLHQFPKYGKISISTNILGDENQFLRFVMP
jgi:hypothetical protein